MTFRYHNQCCRNCTLQHLMAACKLKVMISSSLAMLLHGQGGSLEVAYFHCICVKVHQCWYTVATCSSVQASRQLTLLQRDSLLLQTCYIRHLLQAKISRHQILPKSFMCAAATGCSMQARQTLDPAAATPATSSMPFPDNAMLCILPQLDNAIPRVLQQLAAKGKPGGQLTSMYNA